MFMIMIQLISLKFRVRSSMIQRISGGSRQKYDFVLWYMRGNSQNKIMYLTWGSKKALEEYHSICGVDKSKYLHTSNQF